MCVCVCVCVCVSVIISCFVFLVYSRNCGGVKSLDNLWEGVDKSLKKA